MGITLGMATWKKRKLFPLLLVEEKDSNIKVAMANKMRLVKEMQHWI